MIVMQRCWYLTVRDCGPAGFLAEANYTDTTNDQTLMLEIERRTLLIKRAVLEVHRGQPGAPASATLSSLEGVTAHFGCGQQLRQALADNPDLLDMAAQAVSAVIQAEAFFYQERGFASEVIYDDYWDEVYKNTCVYYSNLDRVEQRFNEYIKEQRRGLNLFHRYLLTAVEETAGASLNIRGHLMDSYHEMALTLKLNPAYQVSEASATMLRCPAPVCREALTMVDTIKGTPLTTANRKRYNSTLGGASGCTHIGHLVLEAAHALEIFNRTKDD